MNTRFEPLSPRSRKVHCTICGRSGYPNSPWQEKCRRPHDKICSCGKAYPTNMGLASHRRKTGHSEA